MVNDMPKILSHCKIIQFADDTTIYITGKNIVHMQEMLQQELNKMMNWFRMNKLKVNPSKTCFILFRTKQSNNPVINLTVNGVPIKRVESTKFLGIHIDENLNWDSHGKKLLPIIKRQMFLINAIKNFLPKASLLSLIHAQVISRMQYGQLLWGAGMLSTTRKMLIKKYDKFVKSYSVKLPSYDELYQKNIALLGYKLKNDQCPYAITNLFPVKFVRNRNLRDNYNLYIYPIKLELVKSSFLYKVPLEWNKLPLTLKTSNSIAIVKKKLKRTWK
jgi:hypothetical protein